MNLSELRAKAMRLALLPGVYLMKDQKGTIIYIGKAKALKNRVSQYFGSQEGHGEKVRRMVSQVDDFDYIVTDSEYEALVLECSLIKQHKPRFNILLKDDKGYTYIKISGGDYPRITAEKQRPDPSAKSDGSRYLGPYTSGFTVRQSVDEACKVFRIPTCRRRFPEDIGKGRACLNFSIKQCMGVCTGRVQKEDYDEAVAQAAEFLRGGTKISIERLTRHMQTLSDNLEFEKAARICDRIRALERIASRQKVVMAKVPVQDVFSIVRSGEHSCVALLRFSGGRLCDSDTFLLDSSFSPEYARSHVIFQYYEHHGDIPPQISLDGPPEDVELLTRWLREKAGRNVNVVVPQRGEGLQIVEMCRANAAEHLANLKGGFGSTAKALDELAVLLGLSAPPEYIESYDISNTGSDNVVAGMVVFEHGAPLKSAYRRFKIRTVQGQDDYASMREVITRRIDEYHKHKDGDNSFGHLPDLILLDGGRQHVAAIAPLIQKSGLNIPLFGMVKDGKHRTRAIACGASEADGGEIVLSGSRAAFSLVSSIQEEVHRFAIKFHRESRGKGVKHLSLTEIPGIGPSRAKALLAHFKTIAAIKSASLDELSAAPGMTAPAAQSVWDYYHK